MPDPDDPDDLYGVAPEEFVAARNAMAKRLRSAGQRDEATIVAKLRRPPQSAWAVNRLARTDPATVDRFLEAASRLATRSRTIRPTSATPRQTFRAAIEDTVSAAAECVGIRDEAMRSRVRNIVLAAGVDPTSPNRSVIGTVADDHDAPGFSVVSGAAHRPRDGSVTGRGRTRPRKRRSRLTVIDGKAGRGRPCRHGAPPRSNGSGSRNAPGSSDNSRS